jgi:hypothetical protein
VVAFESFYPDACGKRATKCLKKRQFCLSQLWTAEPVIHAGQKFVKMREFEGRRGDIAIFDLGGIQ